RRGEHFHFLRLFRFATGRPDVRRNRLDAVLARRVVPESILRPRWIGSHVEGAIIVMESALAADCFRQCAGGASVLANQPDRNLSGAPASKKALRSLGCLLSTLET